MEDEILEFTYKRPQKKNEWIEQTLFVDSCTISSSNRRLKATWSYEATQDLLSQHNIRQHLSDKMLDDMLAEMDRELVNDLRSSVV